MSRKQRRDLLFSPLRRKGKGGGGCREGGSHINSEGGKGASEKSGGTKKGQCAKEGKK